MPLPRLRAFRFAPFLRALPLAAICCLAAAGGQAASGQTSVCGAGTGACAYVEPGDWALIEIPAEGDAPAALSVGSYSQEPVPDLFDRSTPARLSVTCADNRTSVRLRMPGNVLSGVGEYGAVAVSLDGAEPRTVRFVRAETEDTLGLMVGAQAVPFVAALMRGSEVQLDLTTMGERSRTARFSLAGLAEAMTPLRRACNW